MTTHSGYLRSKTPWFTPHAVGHGIDTAAFIVQAMNVAAGDTVMTPLRLLGIALTILCATTKGPSLTSQQYCVYTFGMSRDGVIDTIVGPCDFIAPSLGSTSLGRFETLEGAERAASLPHGPSRIVVIVSVGIGEPTKRKRPMAAWLALLGIAVLLGTIANARGRAAPPYLRLGIAGPGGAR